MKIKISPSILSADKSNLQAEVSSIQAHVEWLHIDIMDGEFVPPTTFDSSEIKPIKTNLVKDVHLMVVEPKDKYIKDYADAGADYITFHQEAAKDIQATINYIRQLGCKVGMSINPPTDLDKLLPWVEQLDLVLIMSVNPGYSGQKFIPEVLNKVKILREKFPDLDIEIDGGISKHTIKSAYEAGANIFVSGSEIFGKEDRIKAIQDLRDAIQE